MVQNASQKNGAGHFAGLAILILLMLVLPPLVVEALPALPLSIVALYVILWGTLVPVLLFPVKGRDWTGRGAMILGGLPLLAGCLLALIAGLVAGWLDPQDGVVSSVLAHLMLGVLWAAAIFFMVQQRWIEHRPEH